MNAAERRVLFIKNFSFQHTFWLFLYAMDGIHKDIRDIFNIYMLKFIFPGQV